MKGVLLLCFVSALLQAEARFGPYTFSNEENECVEELKLDKNAISKLYGYGKTVEDNTDLNNFIHCVWLKSKFQNQDGEINYEQIKETFPIRKRAADDTITRHTPKDMLNEAVNICKSNPVLGNSHGEIAAKVQNCIIDTYRNIKSHDHF